MNYKAFVSSTYIDLKEHRAHVIDALRKAGIHVDPMEDWTADSDEPKRVSVDRMRDCDLCILLVGARRGHIPENEILSITQMEVQEADKRGINVLSFLYDGESAWPPGHWDLDKDQELKRWRADLLEHRCVGKFTHDAASLDTVVRDAVARWLQKQSWPEVHKAYLETLRDAHASIRFLGVGHYKDMQDRPIEGLFVDPCTATQYISPDTSPDQWPETSPLLGSLSTNKRLVLLGDPGSGKSTLVSWIVWSLAQEGENRCKQALKGRTPIVLVLRELSIGHVRTFDDLLAEYFKHWTARLLGSPRYADDVSNLLMYGGALIILDGLDEVGNPQVQERLRQAVWDGMRLYGGCLWLITSRVVGYLGYHEGPEVADVNGGGFWKSNKAPLLQRIYARVLYIAPFADHQIKKFAQNWFASRDHSAIRASEDAGRLINAIHSNPNTLRLARIPNLLTMMALIHRERARLPHGRGLLYADIANAYLQSIDEHRRIERLGYTLRDQKQWLGRIGFEMQLRRHQSDGQYDKDLKKEILAEGQDVRQWVVNAMNDAGRTDSTLEAADAFLDEICRRSGLLLPRGEDLFAFTHLSFQEFFAAVFLVSKFVRPPRRSGSKDIPGSSHVDLYDYAEKPIWHETIVFLVELMFAEQPEWLEELLFCLFGEGFCEITSQTKNGVSEEEFEAAACRKFNQASLLARLAVDPHAGLTERCLKWNAIACCCAYEAAQQNEMTAKDTSELFFVSSVERSGRVFYELLGADREELPRISEMFVGALCDAGVLRLILNHVPKVNLAPFSALTGLQTLLLANTQVSDVGPLAALAGLQQLALINTQVSDVGPLTALTALKRLDLRGTQVSDVGPLSALTGLQSLLLNDTQVSDVGPLSALTGLQSLDLRGTQVSDVGPLSALTGLQYLDLSDTLVSDDQVQYFSKTLGLHAHGRVLGSRKIF